MNKRVMPRSYRSQYRRIVLERKSWHQYKFCMVFYRALYSTRGSTMLREQTKVSTIFIIKPIHSVEIYRPKHMYSFEEWKIWYFQEFGDFEKKKNLARAGEDLPVQPLDGDRQFSLPNREVLSCLEALERYPFTFQFEPAMAAQWILLLPNHDPFRRR